MDRREFGRLLTSGFVGSLEYAGRRIRGLDPFFRTWLDPDWIERIPIRPGVAGEISLLARLGGERGRIVCALEEPVEYLEVVGVHEITSSWKNHFHDSVEIFGAELLDVDGRLLARRPINEVILYRDDSIEPTWRIDVELEGGSEDAEG